MNFKVTPADLKNHSSVSAIIKDEKGRVLVQEHAKYGFVSLPMGKVDEGKSPEETLRDELNEECGIYPVKYKLFDNRLIYHTVNEKDLVADHYMYEIIEYDGKIVNNEEEKHPRQYFISVEEFSRKEHISHVAVVYLERLGIKRDIHL